MGIIILLVLSFLYSLLNSKLTVKEILHLCLYPIYSFGQLIRKLPIIKQIFDTIDSAKHPKHVEKHSFPVVVSAGDKKMNCSIELMEEMA